MGKAETWSKRHLILAVLLLPLFAAACAEVRLNMIPAPPPTAKLRVFVHPVSGPTFKGGWETPHEKWATNQFRAVRKFLKETGIYELPTKEEFASVVGKKTFSSWDWSRKDWSLARQVGQALHTDYAMIMERTHFRDAKYFETVLINVETGKRFKVFFRIGNEPWHRGEWKKINWVAYKEIFRDAKNDLMGTAIRKGRLTAQLKAEPLPTPLESLTPVPPPPAPATEPAPVEKPPVIAKPEPSKIPPTTVAPSPAPVVPRVPKVPPSVAVVPPAPMVSEKPSALPQMGREVDFEKVLQEETMAAGRTQLAVYDIDAIEPFKIAALILSEALREELFQLGRFTLVNRENIVKVLEEMALQQTGLVDEKEAVKAGRGLAAQQIVLGRYGILGKTSVLQTKRVDVETQGTLALGSLKCDLGKEDEMLQHMPQLARKLAGLP
jgi:hypothetical protein